MIIVQLVLEEVLSKLFNEKNTTFGVSTKMYLDTWRPIYPTELKAYVDVNGNQNQGFFNGITILNQNGNASTNWNPVNGFDLMNGICFHNLQMKMALCHLSLLLKIKMEVMN